MSRRFWPVRDTECDGRARRGCRPIPSGSGGGSGAARLKEATRSVQTRYNSGLLFAELGLFSMEKAPWKKRAAAVTTPRFDWIDDTNEPHSHAPCHGQLEDARQP